jgi:hypothetical protein
MARVTATANGLAGPYAVTAGAGGNALTSFILTNTQPSAALSLGPSTSTGQIGQAQTVTATLTVGPSDMPLAGVPVTFRVVAGPNAGATGMLAPADGLTDAAGRVSFTYTGSGGTGVDVLVATATLPSGVMVATGPATIAWAAAPAPAPRVVALHRLGVHWQPTRLVLAFSAALDPARAQDLRNYRLTALGPGGRPGRRVPLGGAAYDPSGPTVTLLPRRRLALRRPYQLTVIGTPPGGLAGADGTFLAGAGVSGTDFTATLLGFGAADTPVPNPERGHLAGAVRSRRPDPTPHLTPRR